MGAHRKDLWRHRQIILPQELVRRLHEWHGGQGSYVYALASTGQNHLVSLSMIDTALIELTQEEIRLRGKKTAQARHLKKTTAELDTVRAFWKEHSAKDAGIEVGDDYDERDYGMTAAEEREIDTHSG